VNILSGFLGTIEEERYFISSLPINIEEAERVLRGHWMVESYPWHLEKIMSL